MSKKVLAIVGAALIAACLLTVFIQGKTITLTVPETQWDGTVDAPEALRIVLEQGTVALTDLRAVNGRPVMRFRAVSPGKTFFTLYLHDKAIYSGLLRVHKSGIITSETYFGDCEGNGIIPPAVFLFTLLLLWYAIRTYRADVRVSLYRYRNIRDLALIFFIAALLLTQAQFLFVRRGLDETVKAVLQSAGVFAIFALPVAFVVSVLVTVSTARLLHREGRTWRNLLAFFLGLALCVSTLLPEIINRGLQSAAFVDVHNERGVQLYVETALETAIFITVAYLECILLATVILSVRAARRIPDFDRDYVLILGCQIREDGTLTKLLQGRADRAVEFARMQKEKTGKDLIFVPSGGKGADETISEAAAIRNYLVSVGVPEDRILTEDRSTNTYENIRNSAALIREHGGGEDAKLAFSTTNYHVFRAGVLAARQGVPAQGIGSKTKRYFWINAFVREFIATVYAERTAHLKVVGAMYVLMTGMVLILYLSQIL